MFDSAKTDPDLPPGPGVERRRSRVGRYSIIQQIGVDGIGTLHLARMAGPATEARVAAIKHVHPHLARDPDFSSVFIDQATLASCVRHRNVLPLLEAVIEGPDIFLVMEQVDGSGLAGLVRAARARQRPIPLPIAVALAMDVLHGVHAVHEARTQTGAPLQILHRAVSPQNVLVGVDGTARLHDVGLAKAWNASRSGRRHRPAQDSCYLAPEQIRQEPLTRAADIFAASALFWELVTSQPLFTGGGELERVVGVLDRQGLRAPSTVAPHVPQPLDRIILKGMAEDVQRRYPTALAMAEAIERVVRPASRRQVAAWVVETAGSALFRSAPLLEGTTAADTARTAVHGPRPALRPGPRAAHWAAGQLRQVRGRLEQVRTRVSLDRRALVGATAAALLIAIALVARGPSAPPALQAELGAAMSTPVVESLPSPLSPDPEPVAAAEPPPATPELPPATPEPPAAAPEPVPTAEAPPAPEPPAPAVEATAPSPADPPPAIDLPPRRRERLVRAALPPPPAARARAHLEEEEPLPEPIEPEVSLGDALAPAAPLAAPSEASDILSEPAMATPERARSRRKRAPLVTENRRVPLLE